MDSKDLSQSARVADDRRLDHTIGMSTKYGRTITQGSVTNPGFLAANLDDAVQRALTPSGALNVNIHTREPSTYAMSEDQIPENSSKVAIPIANFPAFERLPGELQQLVFGFSDPKLPARVIFLTGKDENSISTRDKTYNFVWHIQAIENSPTKKTVPLFINHNAKISLLPLYQALAPTDPNPRYKPCLVKFSTDIIMLDVDLWTSPEFFTQGIPMEQRGLIKNLAIRNCYGFDNQSNLDSVAHVVQSLGNVEQLILHPEITHGKVFLADNDDLRLWAISKNYKWFHMPLVSIAEGEDDEGEVDDTIYKSGFVSGYKFLLALLHRYADQVPGFVVPSCIANAIFGWDKTHKVPTISKITAVKCDYDDKLWKEEYNWDGISYELNGSLNRRW